MVEITWTRFEKLVQELVLKREETSLTITLPQDALNASDAPGIIIYAGLDASATKYRTHLC